MLHDLKLALRGLLARPLLPSIAVVIMALGLAATVSVFTYVKAFHQPFPGADPEGLVRVFGVDDENPYLDVSFLDYEDYARSSESFDGMAVAQPYYAASVRLEELTEVAFVEAVTGDFFRVLRAGAAVGRLLAADDDRLDAEPAAVISYQWWESLWSGDPGVLGTTIYLNYRPFTVVGVAAPEFLGSASDNRPQVWIPIAHFRDRYVSWDQMAQNRDLPLARVYGRLAEGISVGVAEEEMARLAQGLDEAYPREGSARGIRLERATFIDPRTRLAEASRNRIIVIGAVGFLLLVCANVANLLLSVFSGRKREVALQAALGAPLSRLFRGLVMQNLLLALLAGGMAVGFALPLSQRMGSYFARPSVWGETVAREFSLDPAVVVFALLASILTGLLAGGIPTLRAIGGDIMGPLKSGPGGRSRIRKLGRWRIPGVRDLLVSTQVALSVILLVVSGLVLKTLRTAGGEDPGFTYDRVVGSHISTSSTSIEVEGRETFFRQLEEEISREPWVESATFSSNALLSGQGSRRVRSVDLEEPMNVVAPMVHDGFFEKLGIELLGGRAFLPTDTDGAPPVAILNRPGVARLFPDGGAVGGTLWLPGGDGSDQAYEVVGVVGDVKVRNFLSPAEPTLFLPFAQQSYGSGAAIHVVTRGDPRNSVQLLQRWLRAYEPHLAIVNVIAYPDVVRGAIYSQRMNAEMFSALAVLGLILASVGIFGVVSLSVARRTREIGIRKALGASRGDIDTMVVARAMGPVVIGMGAGLAVALGGSRLLENLLFGVEPSDPVGYLGGSLVLLITAGVAAYLPTRRAARVEPLKALRVE